MDWHIGNVWIVALAISMGVNLGIAMFLFRVEWMLKQEDRDIENVKRHFLADPDRLWSIEQTKHALGLTPMRAHMAVKHLVELGVIEGTWNNRERYYHVCQPLYHSADD